MPKPYDDAMKKLVGGNPQDLVSWVLPGAQFGKQLPFELNVENIYADGLLLATLDGKEFLAHIEFQREPSFLESPGFSHGEEKMAVRRQCSSLTSTI